MKRMFVLLGASLIAAPLSAASAQQPAALAVGPKVGEMAPDFEFTGITRFGKLASPSKLSDFRGQTVVLAFFPKARTSGCTAQMHSYRDQYSTLFNGGRGVVVIGISVDADTTLANWFRDMETPFLALGDTDTRVSRLYQTFNENSKVSARHLYVIDGAGKVAYKTAFRALAQDAYTELEAEVDKLSALKPEGGAR